MAFETAQARADAIGQAMNVYGMIRTLYNGCARLEAARGWRLPARCTRPAPTRHSTRRLTRCSRRRIVPSWAP